MGNWEKPEALSSTLFIHSSFFHAVCCAGDSAVNEVLSIPVLQGFMVSCVSEVAMLRIAKACSGDIEKKHGVVGESEFVGRLG